MLDCLEKDGLMAGLATLDCLRVDEPYAGAEDTLEDLVGYIMGDTTLECVLF